MRSLSHTTVLLLLSLLLLACSKFSSKPVIMVMSPIEHTHFNAGESYEFKVKFSDNKGLASYQFSVSDASGNPFTDFNSQDSGELSGKEYTYNRSVQIPANAEGTFYLHFTVVDSDGKQKENFHEFHVDQ